MAIMVKRTGSDFIPCPAGTWPAVCVDVIDLGEMRNEWKGEMVHKIRLVWQVSERMPDGRPYIVQRMYTASLHEKSSLRKDLSTWRGMDFKPEELAGFDLENVLGVGCLLSVIQQAGNDGQMYSNVIAVMRLPTGYEAPQPDGYVRTIHRPDTTPRPAQGQPQSFQPRAPLASTPRSFQQEQYRPPGAHDAGAWGPRQTAPAPQPVQQPVPPGHYEGTDDDVPF